jgi:hypothetical protein
VTHTFESRAEEFVLSAPSELEAEALELADDPLELADDTLKLADDTLDSVVDSLELSDFGRKSAFATSCILFVDGEMTESWARGMSGVQVTEGTEET